MFQLPVLGHRAMGVLLLLLLFVSQVLPQASSVASLTSAIAPRPDAGAPGSPDPSIILASFAAAETRVREALNQHAFKRDVTLQTIGPNGEVTGEYVRNSQFVFDDRGRRIENVLFHPAPTIREMRITKQDIQDLSEAQLLGIDIVEASKYQLVYAGTETIDSRQLYAIDVTPLVQPDPHRMSERFFVGRVWVDPVNFQIAKIKGKVEPQGKQRFPLFETWREPTKGPFAFPVRTQADDVLHFKNRDVHYRIKVRYYDYKIFRSNVSIIELDEASAKPGETKPTGSDTAPNPAKGSLKISEAPKNNESKPKADTAQAIPLTVSTKTVASCSTNREAPPTGPYHWPADSDVKVYFVRQMFTPEQRAALIEAMEAWTSENAEIGSGVKFVSAGETDTRQSCRNCLTVGRREIYKVSRQHYAFFYPMNRDEGRLLISAWIDLDVGITNPKALKGFMVHELAHGLGLWDCTTCKKKRTIMNAFPGINKDNGLVIPSACDLATVRDVYQQERQVAAAIASERKKANSPETNNSLTLSSLDLTKPGFSPLYPGRESAVGPGDTSVASAQPTDVSTQNKTALAGPSSPGSAFAARGLQPYSTVGIAAPRISFNKLVELPRAEHIFSLSRFRFDKPESSAIDPRRPRVDGSLPFWFGMF